MSVHPNDIFVNSRLTLNGNDVTVVDSNGGVVAVAQDDGEVKHYTHDSFVDNAEPYTPPEEAQTPPVPSPSAPGAPAAPVAADPATAADSNLSDSERVATLQAQIDAIKSRQQTP